MINLFVYGITGLGIVSLILGFIWIGLTKGTSEGMRGTHDQ